MNLNVTGVFKLSALIFVMFATPADALVHLCKRFSDSTGFNYKVRKLTATVKRIKLYPKKINTKQDYICS